MASCKSQTIVFARVLLIFGLLTAAVPALARKETGNMSYDFCSAGCTDGRYPKSDLILDTAGTYMARPLRAGLFPTVTEWDVVLCSNFRLLQGARGRKLCCTRSVQPPIALMVLRRRPA